MITTNIDGYDVELYFEKEDHGQVSQCFISARVFGTEYMASLACLDDTGALYNDDALVEVPIDTVNAIKKWAEINGY